MSDRPSERRHGSAVAVAGRGLLILGPSGSGKSALALQLMAHGADLLADDQVLLTRSGAQIIASCPPNLPAAIEARGVGLLAVHLAAPTAIALVADLSQDETERLPPQRSVTLLGCDLPLVFRPAGPHFPFALLCYLKGNRFA